MGPASARKPLAIVLSLSLSLPAGAWQFPQDDEIPAPAIRVSTKMVALDVVVTDKEGRAIPDLRADDFSIEESGKKQKIAIFRYESADRRAAAPPPLPQNVYSNRPEYNMPAGPLTIILLDALNTAFKDQAYARQQMLKWVDTQLQPNQRVAVFGLTNQLFKLQDFSADPTILKAAIARFQPRSLAESSKGEPVSVTVGPNISTSSGGFRGGEQNTAAGQQIATNVLASVESFAASQAAAAIEARIANTLEAFRSIARATAGHSGRKNLIWVSAGFPFTLIPESGQVASLPAVTPGLGSGGPPPTPNEGNIQTLSNQLAVSFNPEIERLASQLADVQMVIYPVDSRGLVGATLADASQSGLDNRGMLQLGREYAQSVSNSTAALRSSIQNMQDIAAQTGGKAYVSRNDIDNAVALASQDGANSYSLGYYSTNKRWNGEYRKIKVTVSRAGVQVRYRPGYFAYDPLELNKKKSKDQEVAFNNAIRGQAGFSTMVLFDAQVAPQPGNSPVTFLVDPRTFTVEDAKEGGKHLSLDLFAVAYGADGKMVKNTGQTIDTIVSSDQYQQLLKQGLMAQLELPLGPGRYQLKLAVRDNRTGYVGTLDVPLTLP
jgi:VWFA-related protein